MWRPIHDASVQARCLRCAPCAILGLPPVLPIGAAVCSTRPATAAARSGVGGWGEAGGCKGRGSEETSARRIGKCHVWCLPLSIGTYAAEATCHVTRTGRVGRGLHAQPVHRPQGEPAGGPCAGEGGGPLKRANMQWEAIRAVKPGQARGAGGPHAHGWPCPCTAPGSQPAAVPLCDATHRHRHLPACTHI